MGFRKVEFPDGKVRHVLDGVPSVRIPRATDLPLKVSTDAPAARNATYEMDEYRIVPDGGGWRAEPSTSQRQRERLNRIRPFERM